MKDTRIEQYKEAIKLMKEGIFNISIPTGPDDDIGQVGRELIELGRILEKNAKKNETLSEIIQKINAGLTIDEILDYMFEAFRPIIPYNRIGFAVLEGNCSTVRSLWVKSDVSPVVLGKGYKMLLNKTSLKKIIDTGKPRILNDLNAYFKEHPHSHPTKLILQEGIQSSLTCPLISQDEPVGFIFFSSINKDTYKNIHTEIFLQIAGEMSVIVKKGQLYQHIAGLNELKNKFLGMAAHDLRSPLSIFKGYIGLLKNKHLGDITDRQIDAINDMEDMAERMSILIDEILDLNVIEAGQLILEKKKINLKTFLEKCHKNYSLLAREKSIHMKLEVEDDIEVFIDKNRIEQVIGNLITNGIKFSYSNTVIILKARALEDNVIVSVIDEGPGIPQNKIHLLFTEFSRGINDPTGGETSTGLGLVISKRIIEAHGGCLWVENRAEKGSIFSFSMPKNKSY